jgi:hypothetical protein
MFLFPVILLQGCPEFFADMRLGEDLGRAGPLDARGAPCRQRAVPDKGWGRGPGHVEPQARAVGEELRQGAGKVFASQLLVLPLENGIRRNSVPRRDSAPSTGQASFAVRTRCWRRRNLALKAVQNAGRWRHCRRLAFWG